MTNLAIITSTSTSTSTATVTSKELATLTELRHDNVKRTIDTLANQGVISYPQIVDGEKSANGVVEKIYSIGKRDSYIIVAQLSPEFTARLVDRWQALEELTRNPAIPQTMSAALRLAADQIEAQQAQLAIASPKAEALDRIATAEGGRNNHERLTYISYFWLPRPPIQ